MSISSPNAAVGALWDYYLHNIASAIMNRPRAGETAQQLRALPALLKHMSLGPSTHVKELKLLVTSVPRAVTSFSCLCGHLNTKAATTHAYINIHFFKKNKLL